MKPKIQANINTGPPAKSNPSFFSSAGPLSFIKTKKPISNNVTNITEILLAPKKAPTINPKRPQTKGNRKTVKRYISIYL